MQRQRFARPIVRGTCGRAVPCLAVALAVALVSSSSSSAGQAGQSGTGQRAPVRQTPAETAAGTVRVPVSHANVHSGPSTGQEVLVLAPRGTTLQVTGRDKEWVQVGLPPELRTTGMVMRWYRNETRGWMHDSTVEFLQPKPPGPDR